MALYKMPGLRKNRIGVPNIKRATSIKINKLRLPHPTVNRGLGKLRIK